MEEFHPPIAIASENKFSFVANNSFELVDPKNLMEEFIYESNWYSKKN
jgi:hypothetical protein